MAPPPPHKPALSAEAKDILQSKGWDKGIVVFGAKLSEATVKVLTAVKMMAARQADFGFPCSADQVNWVDMDFNDKDDTPSGGKLGVWSDTYRKLSNSGPMPAVCINGELFMDSKLILKDFVSQYKDKTLSAADQKEVERLVELNEKWQDAMMEAAVHWGWADFHRKAKMYPQDRMEIAFGAYGAGKKDLAWEKAKIKDIDDFFTEIDNTLKGKPVTGYFVAGKTTFADCALVNWYHTMYDIGNLRNMDKRYPNLYAYYKKQDALAIPDGAKDHQDGFTMFGKMVHLLNLGNRGMCCAGQHDINNPVIWPAKE